MNKILRQAITTAGLLAVVFAPTTAEAQRQQARSPVFLAVTFKSPGDQKLGIEVAEAVRQRMLRYFPFPPRPGQLRIVKQEEINTSLTGSGYPADSAITTTDLRDLGKGMGADESMEGTVKRTANGVEVRAKVYWLNNIAAAEVLPVVVEKDADDAGRKVAELYREIRKELPEYDKCRNALINNDIDNAIVAAKAALVEYDRGVLPRACLLTAYNKLYEQKKFPIDSVMRVANELISIDPENEIALGTMVDAYRQKGDTAKAIEMSMKLYALNPANTQQAQSIIELLASSGAPDKALVIVEDMMKNNPGDASIIETQWKLLQATSQWKRAIAAGEEMVKFDTARADTTYFRRQIGAAYQDSQPQLALQFLARATQKFPRDVRLLQAHALELRKQGQVQQALEVAKKVVAVDPKADQGYATVVVLYTELGQTDSAVAFAKQGLAASPDTATRNSIGAGLLSLIAPAMSRAQADTGATPDVARANWTEVYKLSAAVDSIVPQTSTAFYMSFAAYNLATNALGRVQDLSKNNKPAACAELKTASDMVLMVELNMSRGGRFNPQAAGSILGAVSSQVKPYIESVKKQLSCR